MRKCQGSFSKDPSHNLPLQGIEGIYNFEPNGDGLHGYYILKNGNGKIVFIEHIEFSE